MKTLTYLTSVVWLFITKLINVFVMADLSLYFCNEQNSVVMKKVLVGVMVVIVFFTACEESKEILNEILDDSLTTEEIVEGLKKALDTGIGTSVTSASATDGYLKNEIIKVLLPQEVKDLQSLVDTGSADVLGLFDVKYSTIMEVYVAATPGLDTDPFEQLVIAMNRGAESAATKALPIFGNALTTMSFTDALGILQGGETAATAYFVTNTSSDLQVAFRPDVKNALDQTKANEIYSSLAGFLNYSYKTSFLGLSYDVNVSDYIGQTLPTSIDEYATEKAVGGLFHLVGEEEKKIRANPLDYVSAIIQKVFGSDAAKGI
jgi:hypothetical protein